jgi:hypothetical protein
MIAGVSVEVLELFAEAQHLGRPRKLRPAVLSFEEQRKLRNAFAPRKRARRAAGRLRRIDLELRAKRKSHDMIGQEPGDHAVHQGQTQTRTCGYCGRVEELRPGLSRWQHISHYGACVR